MVCILPLGCSSRQLCEAPTLTTIVFLPQALRATTVPRSVWEYFGVWGVYRYTLFPNAASADLTVEKRRGTVRSRMVTAEIRNEKMFGTPIFWSKLRSYLHSILKTFPPNLWCLPCWAYATFVAAGCSRCLLYLTRSHNGHPKSTSMNAVHEVVCCQIFVLFPCVWGIQAASNIPYEVMLTNFGTVCCEIQSRFWQNTELFDRWNDWCMNSWINQVLRRLSHGY